MDPEDNREKGETIAAEYASAFLTWQLPHGGGADGLRGYFTGEAYPEAILEPSFWDYLPAYSDLTPANCGAIVFESQCIDPDQNPGCFWRSTEQDCVRRPVIKHGFTVPQPYRREVDVLDRPESTTGLDQAVPWGTWLDTSLVVDTEVVLASAVERVTSDLPAAQYTGTLRASWGDLGQSETGWIRWPLQQYDLAPYSHLSFRVGVVSEATGSASSCGTVSDTPLELGVTLWSDTSAGLQARTVPVTVSQQEVQSVEGASGSFCAGRTFMETVRIPLHDFCWEDDQIVFSVTDVEQIDIELPDLGEGFVVDIDTLELTNDPADLFGTCSGPSAAWACKPTESLLVQEASCKVEPIGGACPSGQTLLTKVAPPKVPSGWGGTAFDGWVVHTGPGVVVDPGAPTATELAAIADLCAQACQDQWADTPEVSANCPSAQAFQSVALVASPSLGVRRAIKEEDEDGSGIFAGESLSCDLESDCCLSFDEGLCHAADLGRVTAARLPVGKGAELVAQIDPIYSEVESVSGMVSDVAAVSGHVAYSRCRDGNSSSCPFYLGALDLQATSALQVGIECPAGVQLVTLEDLQVQLLQPALGIDSAGTSDKGFPAGALALETTFDVWSQPQVVRSVNPLPIVVSADGAGFEAIDIPLRAQAPCFEGGEQVAWGEAEVVVRLEGLVIASPPSLSITVPTSFGCPTTKSLTASVSDPDGDLATVRWYVDDVLVDASKHSMTFTESHVLRAVARDARGAASTDVRAITCQ